VRYGSARELLLGLEVVLSDGRIWNGLRTLHKDNAGYSLRQLFAGSEGTLGIITAAAIKIAPKLEAFLAGAMADSVITDAVIALNEEQRISFWRLREDQTEAQKRSGINLKHDVAVPVSRVAELLVRCRAELEKRFPHLVVAPFGHLGDGNIHMNIIRPDTVCTAMSSAEEKDVTTVVHEIVASLDGTFSAEHGIGRTKIELLEDMRSEVEVGLMRKIKAALDPHNLMNPGKVLNVS
jgi:FAD/FMN-containing dehydrogenase